MDYQTGDILIGTKQTSHHYVKTTENSLVVFIRLIEGNKNYFYGWYIGRVDENPEHLIANALHILKITNAKEHPVKFQENHGNMYDLILFDDGIPVFSPYNIQTPAQKTLYSDRLPNI